MPTQEDIEKQHELLATYRRTLAHLLSQRAQFSAGHVPAHVANGITEARENIRRIKGILRDWGGAVENLPDDEEHVLTQEMTLAQPSEEKTAEIIANPSSTVTTAHLLRVFLCHSSQDKLIVRGLYNSLVADGFDPWLDEIKLLPGQDWQQEIQRAVNSADAVIVCLSKSSTTKSGYVQKEIKYALDIADKQTEGSIFIIPIKIEECDIPERIQRWHCVNLFKEGGYGKLLQSLRTRANALGLSVKKDQDAFYRENISYERISISEVSQFIITIAKNNIKVIRMPENVEQTQSLLDMLRQQDTILIRTVDIYPQSQDSEDKED